MNPRLSPEWLRYLVSVGARHDADGWRWKIDPSMRFGGFGPWRPEWSLLRTARPSMPFLGILGLAPRRWGGTGPEPVPPYLHRTAAARPSRTSATSCTSSNPTCVAGLVLDVAGRTVNAVTPPRTTSTTMLTHNRVSLALHHLRGGRRPALLLLHGLGERTPATVPPGRTAGRARSPPSTSPATAPPPPRRRRLHLRDPLADADIALAHLGGPPCWDEDSGPTSRSAGRRPPATCGGMVLADGPGLAGGGPAPTSPSFFNLPPTQARRTPIAHLEMSRDLRPPDYAASFVRLALAGSRSTSRSWSRPGSARRGCKPSPPSPASWRPRSPTCSPATHLLGSDASRSRRAGAGLRGIATAPPADHRRRSARRSDRVIGCRRATDRAGSAGVRRHGADHRPDPPVRDARCRDRTPPSSPSAVAPGSAARQPRLPGDVRHAGLRRAVDRVPRPDVVGAGPDRRGRDGLRRGLRGRARHLHPRPPALVRRARRRRPFTGWPRPTSCTTASGAPPTGCS